MFKIISTIFWISLIVENGIHSVPLMMNENEDIMVPSSRLHREMNGQFFPQINEIPVPPNYPLNDIIPHYRRDIPRVISYQQQIEHDEEPETVFVDMKIDSEEQPETRLINLFINTKRNFA